MKNKAKTMYILPNTFIFIFVQRYSDEKNLWYGPTLSVICSSYA